MTTSAAEFHAETVRKLGALHLYDCLRANKSMAAWGVEARVPFLDLEFIETAMMIDAELAAAPERFPVNPPLTKEAYVYRVLFAQHFPGDRCAATVPGGKSIACSTPAAIAWDAAFSAAADPSGRAIAGVHEAAVGTV